MFPQAKTIMGLHNIELFASNIWTGTAEILVQLQLTLMSSATGFDNTFVAGMVTEKYFSVKLQLVGFKCIYNKHIIHAINCGIYYIYR